MPLHNLTARKPVRIKLKRTSFIVLLLILPVLSFAQESDGYGVNLPRFYQHKLHFGFTIAGSQADFRLNPKPNSEFPDSIIGDSRYSIQTVYTQPAPGFAVGLVSDLRLAQYLRLRCTPNISFNPHRLQYGLATADRDSFKVFQKSVESVFIIVPLELKIQSKRLGNFSAYVIGGGGYALDLSARKNAGSSGSGGANQLDDVVKVQRDDFYYSAGAGTDFYLQYFKLGLELKLQVGTRNLLKPQNNIFSNSIEKARSHMVVFSITFEGS